MQNKTIIKTPVIQSLFWYFGINENSTFYNFIKQYKKDGGL